MVTAAIPVVIPIPVVLAVHFPASSDRAIVAVIPVTAARGAVIAVIPVIALSRPPVTADPDIVTPLLFLLARLFGLLGTALGLNRDALRLAGGRGGSGMLGE
jgi:hypothetical protein